MTRLFDIQERNIGNVQVKVWAEPEYDSDLLWDTDGSVKARLDSGEWVEYCACVRVHHVPTGLSATHYLGSCIDSGDGSALDGYLRDMVGECVQELRAQVGNIKRSILKGS